MTIKTFGLPPTLDALAISMPACAAQQRVTTLAPTTPSSRGGGASETPEAFAMLADAHMRDAIIAAITNLPDRLKLIVRLSFVENGTSRKSPKSSRS